MRYSIEFRDQIYVKGYDLLFFAKNMNDSLSSQYGQKILDSTKKSARFTQNCFLKGIPKNRRSNW